MFAMTAALTAAIRQASLAVMQAAEANIPWVPVMAQVRDTAVLRPVYDELEIKCERTRGREREAREKREEIDFYFFERIGCLCDLIRVK